MFAPPLYSTGFTRIYSVFCPKTGPLAVFKQAHLVQSSPIQANSGQSPGPVLLEQRGDAGLAAPACPPKPWRRQVARSAVPTLHFALSHFHCKLSKNGRVSAAHDPHYHVLVGMQQKVFLNSPQTTPNTQNRKMNRGWMRMEAESWSPPGGAPEEERMKTG
jgi:hypothetical protein